MLLQLFVILSVCYFWSATAQNCGDGLVPFAFEVDQFNHPILHCAKTDCVGEGTVEGQAAAAHCETNYFDTACHGLQSWVGAMLIRHKSTPAALQCCTFPAMKWSTIVDRRLVAPGGRVSGGEVMTLDGRKVAFDVIGNVEQRFTNAGSLTYTVTMQRFPCVQGPPEVKNDVEIRFPYEYKQYARALAYFLNLIKGKTKS